MGNRAACWLVVLCLQRHQVTVPAYCDWMIRSRAPVSGAVTVIGGWSFADSIHLCIVVVPEDQNAVGGCEGHRDIPIRTGPTSFRQWLHFETVYAVRPCRAVCQLSAHEYQRRSLPSAIDDRSFGRSSGFSLHQMG